MLLQLNFAFHVAMSTVCVDEAAYDDDIEDLKGQAGKPKLKVDRLSQHFEIVAKLEPYCLWTELEGVSMQNNREMALDAASPTCPPIQLVMSTMVSRHDMDMRLRTKGSSHRYHKKYCSTDTAQSSGCSDCAKVRIWEAHDTPVTCRLC